MIKTIGARIKEARKALGLNQTDFGKRIAVGQGYLTNIETGAREATEKIILLICREFGISEAWLRDGKGKMFSATVESDMSLLFNIMNGTDEFAKSLFREFARMDALEWAKLRELVMKLQTGIISAALDEDGAADRESRQAAFEIHQQVNSKSGEDADAGA